jgi:hypothetical protein
MQPGLKIGRADPAKDPKKAPIRKWIRSGLTGWCRRRAAIQQTWCTIDPRSETTVAGLPAIEFPAAITPKAIYTLTTLQNTTNPDGGRKLISFLLGSKGLALPDLAEIDGSFAALKESLVLMNPKAISQGRIPLMGPFGTIAAGRRCLSIHPKK